MHRPRYDSWPAFLFCKLTPVCPVLTLHLKCCFFSLTYLLFAHSTHPLHLIRFLDLWLDAKENSHSVFTLLKTWTSNDSAPVVLLLLLHDLPSRHFSPILHLFTLYRASFAQHFRWRHCFAVISHKRSTN